MCIRDRIEPDIAALFMASGTHSQRLIEVISPVTIKTNDFRFTDEYKGLEVISQAGTVIGHDGAQPVITPHDECILIMPTHRPRVGQTAVRLGRYID